MKNSLFYVIVFIWISNSAYAQINFDFEKNTPGESYSEEHWLKQGCLGLEYMNRPDLTLVDTALAHSGNHSLRVKYPKGGVGPKESGHQAPCSLEPSQEYYLSYWLYFSPDFSWGTGDEGGKLPGLAGGDKCSGGETCDGTNGYTARFMWREGGRAVLYLYHMNKPHKWGEDFQSLHASGENVIFPPGEWINLKERVRVNSPEKENGEVEVWYNGEQVLSLSGLKFVTNTDQVDEFYFSTFHGGNTPEWAPRNDCYIWFDDIRISTIKEDLTE